MTWVGSHNIAFIISYAIFLEADRLANWFRNTFRIRRILINGAFGTILEFTSFDANIGVAESFVPLWVHQIVASVNGTWRDARMVIGARWIALHGCECRAKKKINGMSWRNVCYSYDTDLVSSIWWKLRELNKRKHKHWEPCKDTRNHRPCRNCTYRIYNACRSYQQILPGDIERILLTLVNRIFSVPKSSAEDSEHTNRLVQLELKWGFAGEIEKKL